jgi:hypothetical protein
MTENSEDKEAEPGTKITRRQMLRGVGILAPTPSEEPAQDKGMISGIVKYPWGIVKNATVSVTGKSATSDSSGRYELSGLEPGVYDVVAEAPFPGYDAPPHNTEITAGETRNVDIYLDFKKTIVDGYVYDQKGKPIEGATISGVLCGKGMEPTATNEKGYFKYDRASPGPQFIRVNAERHMGETRDFTAPEATTTTLEFRLAPATCKVHGMVTDKNGQPLRAEVCLSKYGIITQKTWTDPKTGYYELPLLPGTYDILANVTDYLSEGWRGDISTDTKVDLSLEIAPEPEPEPVTRKTRGKAWE